MARVSPSKLRAGRALPRVERLLTCLPVAKLRPRRSVLCGCWLPGCLVCLLASEA